MIRLRALLHVMCLGLFLLVCARTSNLKVSLEELNVKPRVERLIKAQPSYFDSPYTLVVILDRQACGGNLTETRWWPDWQRMMHKNGCGFVFATSRRDSSEMVTALEFENLDAPILVLPGSEQYVWEPDSPFRSMSLKLLADSSDVIHRGWLSVVDSASNDRMVSTIDSLVSLGP